MPFIISDDTKGIRVPFSFFMVENAIAICVSFLKSICFIYLKKLQSDDLLHAIYAKQKLSIKRFFPIHFIRS